MTRILVIEPELRSRHALRHMLEIAGYEVEVAECGSDGMEYLRENSADLVIADIGDAASEDVRKALASTKFIAVPGDGRASCDGAAEAARKLGAAGMLPKPFRRDDLLATVRATLQPVHPGSESRA